MQFKHTVSLFIASIPITIILASFIGAAAIFLFLPMALAGFAIDLFKNEKEVLGALVTILTILFFFLLFWAFTTLRR